MRLWHWLHQAAMIVLVMGWSAGAGATEVPAGDPAPGDDELLLFADLPTVISAARRAQPVNRSAVPVSILDAAMIHYSGLTNVAELLQFAPGVDVHRIDRNRYIVGVRGMHHQQAERTLVLINGRNAMNPLFGATHWTNLPLMIEDIDRIEIVRGPGGAAWGANAFNGVINIITRVPADTLGFLVSSTFNEHGDTYNQFRWGAQKDDWTWRFSGAYTDHGDSDQDMPLLLFGPGATAARDFGRSVVFDGVAQHDGPDGAVLSFGLAGISQEAGPYEFTTVRGDEDRRYEEARLFARLDRDFNADRSGYVQWAGRVLSVNDTTLWRYAAMENDLEAQYQFVPAAGHAMTVGGNVRLIHIDQHTGGPQDYMLVGEPIDEQWAGLFLMDRWTVTDRLTLEGQARVDYYSEGGADWSGRLAALYALDEQEHHVLRVAAAKSFRAVPPGLHHTTAARGFGMVGLPPGVPGIVFTQPDELDNEQVHALEAGYTGRLTTHLTLRADAYFQHYEDLVGYRLIDGDPAFATLDNIDGAEAYGVDLALEWRTEQAAVTMWYAYEQFSLDGNRAVQDIRSFHPARHKAGVTLRYELSPDWLAAANYKYSSAVETFPVPSVDAVAVAPSRSYHRLDLTLTRRICGGRGELMFGVTDVLDDAGEAVRQVGQTLAHETPGRTFFGRLQLKF